jgi:enoyl-[acyl-carrier protein] reductase II
MGWISGGELAAAVSNGGGLGIIAASNMDGEAVRQEIHRARALTGKRFGVNVMLMSPHVDEVARMVMEERVPVLTTGGGSPKKYMRDWLAADMQVLPVIASLRNAQSAIRAGATALIASGSEGGGHIGDITTMALVPQIRAYTDLPVLAAGGIVNGRGAAACFMLGAEGLQLGTRFLAATEAKMHPTYKRLVLEADGTDTIVTGVRMRQAARSLKTAFTDSLFKAQFDPAVTDEQLEEMATGSLRRAAVDGDELKGSFMAGQGVGMVNKEQPAAEIIREIFAEMEQILTGAAKWIK